MKRNNENFKITVGFFFPTEEKVHNNNEPNLYGGNPNPRIMQI